MFLGSTGPGTLYTIGHAYLINLNTEQSVA
jgi:hypothetical protein